MIVMIMITMFMTMTALLMLNDSVDDENGDDDPYEI